VTTRKTDSRYLRTEDTLEDGSICRHFKDGRFSDFCVVEAVDGTTEKCTSGSDHHNEMADREATGDTSFVGFLSAAELNTWNLVVWFEVFVWPAVSTLLDTFPSWSDDQKKRGVGASLVSWGFEKNTAWDIAVAYVDSEVKPKCSELGLSNAPETFAKMLSAETDWEVVD
jgi:hypothetical protein